MKNVANPYPDFFFKQKLVSKRYERMKAILLDRGYRTIQDFANDLGTSRSYVSLVMHCHTEPTPAMKITIAAKLKTDSRIIFPEVTE